MSEYTTVNKNTTELGICGMSVDVKRKIIPESLKNGDFQRMATEAMKQL